MQRTLFELVEDILVSLDGDEVTSITDTAESRSIAAIVRQSFYQIASNEKLPEHHTLFELTETSATTPVVLSRPSGIMTVNWVKYDNTEDGETDYRDLTFLPFQNFIDMNKGLDSESDGVQVYDFTMNGETFPILCHNDRQPTYYTSPNDSAVLFDSYDSEIETFIRKSKTMCYGLKESVWTHTDSFVPPLDHKLSNLLFQSAKAQAFSELKQVENGRAERGERRARLTLQKDKADINGENMWYYYNERQLPNYGRRR